MAIEDFLLYFWTLPAQRLIHANHEQFARELREYGRYTAELKSQVEATKVKAIAEVGEVAAKLNEHSDTLEVLHKEAPALITSANMAKNRALKVTGASGLSQPQVLQILKWEDSHEKILKLHSQLVAAKVKHTEYVEKLGLSYEMQHLHVQWQ